MTDLPVTPPARPGRRQRAAGRRGRDRGGSWLGRDFELLEYVTGRAVGGMIRDVIGIFGIFALTYYVLMHVTC